MARSGREAALKAFNAVASELGLDTVALRAHNNEIGAFWKELCKHLKPEHLEAVAAAKREYLEHNGIADMPEQLLKHTCREEHLEQYDADGAVPSHRKIDQSFYNDAKRAFRLSAKAFMLTFNSVAFVLSKALWEAFRAWVLEGFAKFGASAWNATLEVATTGAVHLLLL